MNLEPSRDGYRGNRVTKAPGSGGSRDHVRRAPNPWHWLPTSIISSAIMLCAGCATSQVDTPLGDNYRQECNRYYFTRGIQAVNGLPYSQLCAMVAVERLKATRRARHP